jgi:Asp-tRNA(Asn)/Glu-tRNA(Gln) amidotransferase A subunit family amidase
MAAVKTPVWDQAEEHARHNFSENIQTLQKAGARVEEVELPGIFNLAHRAIRTIMAVEAALNLEELYLREPPVLSPTLRDFITEGRKTEAVVYMQALKLRLALKEELERFLEKYDALITPPTTGEAPATLEQTGNPTFCSIWSLCGVPAITIPVGFGPRRLPLGLQIVGVQGKDERVLSIAHWCEGLFSFPGWSA